MVAAGPVTPFSSHTAGGGAGGASDPAREAARIKAEILSARSEKQCTDCEGDKEKLDQEIRELEAKLRRVESAASAAAPRDADPSRPSDGAVHALETVAAAARSDPFDPRPERREPAPEARDDRGRAAARGDGTGRLVNVVV